MKNEEFCDIMRQDERKNRSKTGKGNKTMENYSPSEVKPLEMEEVIILNHFLTKKD